MSNIQEAGKKILEEGNRVLVGYCEGTQGNIRPFFAANAEQAAQLVYDERCRYNLAAYLNKKEVISSGKPAVVANIPTLRGIMRLAVEKQLEEDAFSVLVGKDGQFEELHSFSDMENYLKNAVLQSLNEDDQKLYNQLCAMTPQERWDFWKSEFETCIKCYACRQTCPLCYCSQCTAEENQPQWLPVASHLLGNTEWHLMRAMHLAGRCVTCGQCGEACPMGIPVHLLTIHVAKTVEETYGIKPGLTMQETSAMSTYQPNDQENFIR